jgi:hypothetical protein
MRCHRYGDLPGEKTAFNKKVAEELRRLGWTVRHDVNVTEILGKGTDETFGDIKTFGDVDTLAWSPETGDVLVLECKDLVYRKTAGEIAEQLSKFRGEADANGKPDLLLKHLNRVAILNAHLPEVSKFTGLAAPKIHGHLVFSGQVSMGYARQGIISKTSLVLFDEIEQRLSPPPLS